MSKTAIFFVGLLLVAAGVATGLLVVNATKDSSKGSDKGAVTTFDTTSVETVTVPQKTIADTTTVVTPDNQTVTVKIDSINGTYCKTNPQICASIESDVLKTLSVDQQNAISVAKQLCKSTPAKCAGTTQSQGGRPEVPQTPTPVPRAPRAPSGGGSGGVSSP